MYHTLTSVRACHWALHEPRIYIIHVPADNILVFQLKNGILHLHIAVPYGCRYHWLVTCMCRGVMQNTILDNGLNHFVVPCGSIFLGCVAHELHLYFLSSCAFVWGKLEACL